MVEAAGHEEEVVPFPLLGERTVESERPDDVVDGVQDDEDENCVAEVENDLVHATGRDGAGVLVS